MARLPSQKSRVSASLTAVSRSCIPAKYLNPRIHVKSYWLKSQNSQYALRKDTGGSMLSAADFLLENIELPPARKVNRHGQARHLTEAEMAELFTVLPNAKWRCVFAIAYFTGSRISEVLSLDVKDIGREAVLIRQVNTKTRKTRSAMITPGLRSFLEAYEAPMSGYLFPAHHNGPTGGHLGRQGADGVLREACEYIGLEGVSTHSFRRSFATNLSRQGISLAKIARLLGHESASMTARYVE